MRNIDENTITQAVLDTLTKISNPRTRQISDAIVRHLHDFVRDVRPTQEEWGQAIEFLTAAGHMCKGNRQEFILLSDTLGVSMLVDAINHPPAEDVTDSTVVGPFYVESPPEFPLGGDITGRLVGQPMFASGCVTGKNGMPLAGAVVDIWHSDEEGFYDVQKSSELAGRGRFHTDADGRFHFWSIKPAAYPIPHDGPVGKMLKAQGRHPWRPAHVHFRIEAEGHETLITHVFVAGSSYLDSDAVFGVKDSLIQKFETCPAGQAPGGRQMDQEYVRFEYDFQLRATGPAGARDRGGASQPAE